MLAIQTVHEYYTVCSCYKHVHITLGCASFISLVYKVYTNLF